jgi:hypothetical protein
MSRLYLLIAALGLVLVGCGAPPKASVSGTVRFKGQPLPSGTVLFHGADGRVEHSLISAEGKYTIEDAPLGLARITVKSHGAAPPKVPLAGKEAPKMPPELAPRPEDLRDSNYVRIPGRYLNPDSSGLRYEVRPGSQAHDIELQP